ncbi:MAG: DUF5050 domain-containing protein [Nitrospiraceae bacterium]
MEMKNNRMASVQVMLANALLCLAGCSSGGDQGTSAPPVSAVTAEGLWTGTTTTARTVTGIILDNGSFWVLYSAPNNSSIIAGGVQGTSSSSNGNFSSMDARDFNLEGGGINNATIAGNYVAKQSLSGTITYPSLNQAVAFSGVYDAAYDLTPSLATIAGSYSGTAAVVGSIGESATVAISQSGAVSGVGNSGCTFTGTVAPRAKGNVYDVTVTFGGGVCSNGNSTVTGIGYFDAGSNRLYSAAVNSARTNGFIFVGTKSPGPSPLAKVILGRSTNGNLDMYLSNIDGSAVVTLAADSTISERFSRVVGNQVIYHTSPVGPLVPRDIWKVNLDGTGAAQLVSTGADEFASGVTATWLVYGISQTIGGLRDLASVSLDGSTQRVLASSGDDEYFRSIVGERVIYERRVGSQVNPQSNNTDIYSINADGTDVRPIATTALEEFDQATVGNRLIFVRRNDPSSPADLLIANIDGTGAPITLAGSPDSEFFGAVAGNRMIYMRGVAGGGQFDLYAVNLDGTGTTPLSLNPGNEFFAVVVGDRVVYERTVNGQTDIYSVNLNGTGEVPLATGPGDEFTAGVAGDRIIFRRDNGGQDDLYAIRADGTGGEVALVTSALDELFAAVVGDRLIFQRQQPGSSPIGPLDLYSVRLDGTGLTPLAASQDNEDFVGSLGSMIFYERRTGGQISSTPRDLFAIPADGSAAPTPFANTSADEFFAAAF